MPRDHVSPVLAGSPAVRRYATNVLLAQKRYLEVSSWEPTREAIVEFALGSFGALKNFYISGGLSVEEFEALVDVAIRAEGL